MKLFFIKVFLLGLDGYCFLFNDLNIFYFKHNIDLILAFFLN